MKRVTLSVFAFLLVCSFANAYNPPVNAEGLYELSSARLLSSASSVTGGGIFNANPASITINPALPSQEQRVSANAGYTFMVSSNSENSSSLGNALQLGMLIPTKWTVIDVYLSGIFVPFVEMDLANTFNAKVGLSKEITDKLSFGIGFNTGAFWGKGNDWSLSASLGILYNAGDAGFIKDMRFGASLMNLGKNYETVQCTGVNPTEEVSAFPTLCTLRLGTSGLFVNNDTIKFGYSLDLATPLFQNLMADVGLECSIKNLVYISVAERFNLKEFSNGKNDFIPSIGIGLKFRFGFTENQYFEKKGWKESELATTFAYKQMYETVNCISAEIDVKLGMEDNTPPVIILWLDEEGDE